LAEKLLQRGPGAFRDRLYLHRVTYSVAFNYRALVTLPTELVSLLDEVDTEDLDIYVTQVTKDDTTLFVRVQIVASAYYREEVQHWDIHLSSVLASRIDFAPSYIMELSEAHPLLWEYEEAHADLYIRGTCSVPEVVIAALHQSHYETFGNLRSIEESLNMQLPISIILRRGYGLLATGSVSLMQRMAGIVRQAGIDANVVVFDHTKPESKPIVLVQIGESYIIAREAVFLRRDSER
jgi:hypothetical protein